MHVHLRQDSLLRTAVRDTAWWCGAALVMPNTVPPVATAKDVVRYRAEIERAAIEASAEQGTAAGGKTGARMDAEAASERHTGFTPLMSFKLLDSTDPEEVLRLKEAGAVAGKYYPRGATTNAEDGVRSIESVYPVLEMMEKHDLVLCIHGEEPSEFCMDRERAFLPVIDRIVRRFPSLRVVMEHVTTADAVETVRSMPSRVAATITVHHLVLTLDDVVGGFLQPHHFCKPVAKRPEDRDALRNVVLEGHPRFFFGSDSAPHLREHKECAEGCAGVYSAPVAIPVLAEFFSQTMSGTPEDPHAGHGGTGDDRPGWVKTLENFTGVYGKAFYGVSAGLGTSDSGIIDIVQDPWTVPAESGGVVPFFAGKKISWRLTPSIRSAR
jgi:dihydroorotase